MIQIHTCDHCNGTGEIEEEICISNLKIPKKHKNQKELELIMEDAGKAIRDHEKLCELNPKAKDSYDRQLSETLKKLDLAADALL